MIWEPERLDDQQHLTDGDPGGMLLAVAASAAQVRTGYRTAIEAGIDRLAAQGRPRAIVVAGMGGSAIAGDLMAAVCGRGAPTPFVTLRSYQLPGWVGATDLVVAVSSSGRTEETLSVAAEAVRRGCSLLAVGGAGSPLEAVATQSSALFVPVPTSGQPRANLWLLTVPLIVAAASLGLVQADAALFEDVATALENIAHQCRPSSESFVNPGKTLAMELAESLPMIWGTSPLAAAAGYRLACQLGENAKYPAVFGELPEAGHNQLVAFDGPLAQRDLFADTPSRTLRLVMLRDADEHPQVTRQREVSLRLARDRDVPVTELAGEGAHPLQRVATLIGLGDYASTYLALGYGIDPTPVAAITELKARISQ
ncbi:SIS domain-containing protein [Nonomuraea cavernae]|uniref:Phosphate starvation-inducible protein PsiE n=1 Tax=Nonomuraea cavernae TaxID=2045107 RepID=A0A918DNP8_9ACTN|nr:SIS domain-containing protein [Nonomuraea cavernae]MCA2185741.1 mannose-6-phosphate isomerase [Nonomuraea cavernae]GGO75777.1 phosphate starvation-inducible protein PsiE [Nonomuraea cavernae]